MKQVIMMVTTVGVVCLAAVTHNLLTSLRPFQALPDINDNGRCTLRPAGPVGAEDLVITSSGNWIITSSLDLGHFAEQGVDACTKETGGLWALSTQSTTNEDASLPQSLILRGMPDSLQACFQTHGLYFSDTSQRLYVVAHHGYYSSIEIFSVEENEEENDETKSTDMSGNASLAPTLTWIRSVTSPHFPNLALNDVVEGLDAQELYVTQWIPVSVPAHGRPHPSTWWEWLEQALVKPIFLLGIHGTTVWQCTFTDDMDSPADCRKATSTRFRVANGIAINENRTRVYVNDVFGYHIGEFERDSTTGQLLHFQDIPLKYAVDNIDWKKSKNGDGNEEEEIWMGSIPDLISILRNDGKPFEDRLTVVGGLGVVRRSATDRSWSPQRIVWHHDGSLLSQISSACLHQGKVYMGSAYSKGVLICDV